MEGYNVKLSWDDEAKVWLANCEEIPIAMEDGSFDKLIYRVKKSLNKLSAAIEKLSDKVDKIERLEQKVEGLEKELKKLL